MDYKKIKINESTYVKLFDDDRFEVHCSATLCVYTRHLYEVMAEFKNEKNSIIIRFIICVCLY